MLHEYHVIYNMRYYSRFHTTAVGLGTFYPWIRRHWCNTYCFSTKTVVAQTRLSSLLYTACLVLPSPSPREQWGSFLAAKPAWSKHIYCRGCKCRKRYTPTLPQAWTKGKKKERRKVKARTQSVWVLSANCLYSVQLCQAEGKESKEVW
jgi:hypothetical protein